MDTVNGRPRWQKFTFNLLALAVLVTLALLLEDSKNAIGILGVVVPGVTALAINFNVGNNKEHSTMAELRRK